MDGTYQVVSALSTAGAAMARTRAPEWAAKALAQAVVNMAVREPQALWGVNAISGIDRSAMLSRLTQGPVRMVLGPPSTRR